ncbi:hypothetical protein HYT05_02665 [Candidatus Kaiserbacteria bacterium]|nr:hypothetical protein [Candidatus Kaiserbacteria bacterium]
MPNNNPDQNPFDTIHTEARIYPEMFSLQIRDGMFYLAFRSGQHSEVYTTNLVFAKRLGRMIMRQIEEFEKANNVQIEGTLPDEPMKSPIQKN